MLPTLDYNYTLTEEENLKELYLHSGYPPAFVNDITAISVDTTTLPHPDAILTVRYPAADHPLAQVNGGQTKEHEFSRAPLVDPEQAGKMDRRVELSEVAGKNTETVYQTKAPGVIAKGATYETEAVTVDNLDTEYLIAATPPQGTKALYGTATAVLSVGMDTTKAMAYNTANNTVYVFSPYFDPLSMDNPITGELSAQYGELINHPHFSSVRKLMPDYDMLSEFLLNTVATTAIFYNQYSLAGYSHVNYYREWVKKTCAKHETDNLIMWNSDGVLPTATKTPDATHPTLNEMHPDSSLLKWRGVDVNGVANPEDGMSPLLPEFTNASSVRLLTTDLACAIRHYRFNDQPAVLKYNEIVEVPASILALGTDWSDMIGEFSIYGREGTPGNLTRLSFNTENVAFQDDDAFKAACLEVVKHLVNTALFHPMIMEDTIQSDNNYQTVSFTVISTPDPEFTDLPLGQWAFEKPENKARATGDFYQLMSVTHRGELSIKFTNLKPLPDFQIPEILPGFARPDLPLI